MAGSSPGPVYRALCAIIALLAVSLGGCASAPDASKKPQRPSATEVKVQPSQPAATRKQPVKRQRAPEELPVPPKPVKPPMIEGGGG